MADLNKVFLMGRLTFDPELRYTPGGSAVTDLRMAINRSWTNRDGERKEETLFIDVTVWDRQAENCCQYLKKGSQVHIEGSLKMDTWDDKTTGEKRSKIKILADRVQFLDRRGDAGEMGSEADYQSAPSAAPPRRGPAPGAGNGPGRGYGSSSGMGAGPGPGPGAGPAGRRPAPPMSPDHDAEPEDDIPF